MVQWRVIARLRPGVTVEQAQAQADAVAAQSRSLSLPIKAQICTSGSSRCSAISPRIRPAIVALMGAAIFLLLIACSNVANLFLVRASLRARDLAVRAALGASRWRLLRQRLAEALLVAAFGSVLGFALGLGGHQDLLAIAPANLPRRDAIGIDPAALAFSIGAGLCAALFFGIVPAIRAARPDLAQVLRASGRASGLAGGSLARNLVVVAEVALCFILLVGSGLMFRSFLALQRIDPGFDPRATLILPHRRPPGRHPRRARRDRPPDSRRVGIDSRRRARHRGQHPAALCRHSFPMGPGRRAQRRKQISGIRRRNRASRLL